MYTKLTKGIERRRTWCVDMDVLRDDPHLLAVVDALGTEACSGTLSCLVMLLIPPCSGSGCRCSDGFGSTQSR
jgi:hypothetical protein